MPGGEDRYVLVKGRPGSQWLSLCISRYDWALLVAPKYEDEARGGRGRRYCVKKSVTSAWGRQHLLWDFEEQDVAITQASGIVVCFLVGKVKCRKRLECILRKVPMRPECESWNGISWVKEALEALNRDGTGLGRSVTTWIRVRDAAIVYAEHKETAHRSNNGQEEEEGQFDRTKVPTFDLFQTREIIA